MRTKHLLLVLCCVPVVLWWAASPLGLRGDVLPDDGVRYPVTGLVIGHADGAIVRIAHDDIPGFMPAMTMPFTVVPSTAAAALAPGDRVRFTLVVRTDATVIEGIDVTGRDPVSLRRLASEVASTSRRLHEGDEVPSFRLTDHTGAPTTEADLRGVVTVATFIFTRCPLPDYCPAMMTRLKSLSAQARKDPALADRLRLMAISIDPEFDSVEILKQYAMAQGVDAPAVRLLTGSRDEVDALTAAFAVVARRSAISIDHTLTTAVIGGDGTVSLLLRGNGWSVDEALRAVKAEVLRNTYSRQAKTPLPSAP